MSAMDRSDDVFSSAFEMDHPGPKCIDSGDFYDVSFVECVQLTHSLHACLRAQEFL